MSKRGLFGESLPDDEIEAPAAKAEAREVEADDADDISEEEMAQAKRVLKSVGLNEDVWGDWKNLRIASVANDVYERQKAIKAESRGESPAKPKGDSRTNADRIESLASTVEALLEERRLARFESMIPEHFDGSREKVIKIARELEDLPRYAKDPARALRAAMLEEADERASKAAADGGAAGARSNGMPAMPGRSARPSTALSYADWQREMTSARISGDESRIERVRKMRPPYTPSYGSGKGS